MQTEPINITIVSSNAWEKQIKIAEKAYMSTLS